MKNDIFMFHRLMRAMPLNREMSVGDICRAVQNDGGPVVEDASRKGNASGYPPADVT